MDILSLNKAYLGSSIFPLLDRTLATKHPSLTALRFPYKRIFKIIVRTKKQISSCVKIFWCILICINTWSLLTHICWEYTPLYSLLSLYLCLSLYRMCVCTHTYTYTCIHLCILYSLRNHLSLKWESSTPHCIISSHFIQNSISFSFNWLNCQSVKRKGERQWATLWSVSGLRPPVLPQGQEVLQWPKKHVSSCFLPPYHSKSPVLWEHKAVTMNSKRDHLLLILWRNAAPQRPHCHDSWSSRTASELHLCTVGRTAML